MIGDELDQLTARQMRLQAERSGSGAIPPANRGATFQAMLAAERSLLATRAAARSQRKAQLREQSGQRTQEIDGLRL